MTLAHQRDIVPLMSELALCPGCHRHVKTADSVCPFCHGAMPAGQLAMGALAIGIALSMLACYGPPPVETGGGNGGATTGSSSSSSTALGGGGAATGSGGGTTTGTQ
jgi:hypothetical protein